MRNKVILLAVCALALAAWGDPASRAQSNARPNIIFIQADDLGYGDLGAYGQQKIRTPHLDRMAREGTRFTQYYAGSTVCAPSRCALMTGYHTGHAYVRGNAGNGGLPLRPEDVTVAEVLKTAGYATAIVGKWGLGVENSSGRPDRQGFDESFGFLDQVHAHRQYTDHLFKNGEKVAVNESEFANDLFAEAALDLIRRRRAGPFFLYLNFTIPHAELQAPEDSLKEYRGKFAETPYSNPKGDAMKFPPYQQGSLRSNAHPRATYAAMITRMDGYVGRVLALLAELKLDGETIVFFTSDNGATTGAGMDPAFFDSTAGLRGLKRDLYEGGIRAPMIARWPGKIKAGTVSDQVWAHWDFLPTAAELARTKAPAGIDGISMTNALLNKKPGKKQRNHEFLYWEFHERGFTQAVRMGDWKAVRKGLSAPLELYDLKTDRGERRNLAAERAGVVAKIETYLKTARADSERWAIAGQ